MSDLSKMGVEELKRRLKEVEALELNDRFNRKLRAEMWDLKLALVSRDTSITAEDVHAFSQLPKTIATILTQGV